VAWIDAVAGSDLAGELESEPALEGEGRPSCFIMRISDAADDGGTARRLRGFWRARRGDGSRSQGPSEGLSRDYG